jgi:hypothetical protein
VLHAALAFKISTAGKLFRVAARSHAGSAGVYSTQWPTVPHRARTLILVSNKASSQMPPGLLPKILAPN